MDLILSYMGNFWTCRVRLGRIAASGLFEFEKLFCFLGRSGHVREGILTSGWGENVGWRHFCFDLVICCCPIRGSVFVIRGKALVDRVSIQGFLGVARARKETVRRYSGALRYASRERATGNNDYGLVETERRQHWFRLSGRRPASDIPSDYRRVSCTPKIVHTVLPSTVSFALQSLPSRLFVVRFTPFSSVFFFALTFSFYFLFLHFWCLTDLYVLHLIALTTPHRWMKLFHLLSLGLARF